MPAQPYEPTLMNTIKRIDKGDYTIIQLDRGKANAINAEMLSELQEVFRDLEADTSVRGVVLTGKPHFFSAGLDLIELFHYDREQISGLFESLGALYLQLVRFPKPFVCAITGHAPAGGCVLAVTSDNRYMAEGDKYVIGLNEVAVNIQISQNLTEAYAFWIGDGLASRYVLEGKLLSGPEALSVGLVDELLPPEQVLERAEGQVKAYLEADTEIWANTKKKVRKHWLDKLDTDAAGSLKEAATLWWKPEIRKKMEAYVSSFSNKKTPKSNE